MKLLIMGAGYVGMALLEHLKKNASYEVFLTTTSPQRIENLKPYATEVVLLDPKKPDQLKEWVDLCDAAIILVAPKNPDLYEETYLNTAKQFDCILKERQTPFYILYTSSTSVCEGQSQEWVEEDTLLNPASKNAKILVETEKLYLSCNATGCILRLGGIYGPNRELVERARRFSKTELPGTGDEPTNSIHRDDIVRALIFCLNHSLKGIYHLVNEDHPTRKELYTAICHSIQLPPPLWNPSLLEEKKKGYKISNKKIKKAGFRFKHPHILFN